MAQQTFIAGQVLTAAQMTTLQTNDFNQTVSTKTASYVLVAADKGTRVVMNSASATTITVNTSLFSAGDILYLQNIGAGVCTVTAGTATVSSAGPLAIPQWGSGTLYFTSTGVSIYFPSAVTATTPGLVLISTTTIGSAVASVTVSNAFSSTYDNYKIIVSGGAGSVADNCNLTLGATATGYYQATFILSYAGVASYSGTANGTSWVGAVMQNTNVLYANIDLLGPNLAKETNFISTQGFTSTTAGGQWRAGYLNNTTQYTAFTITTGSGTLTGGTIKVYGWANS